MSYFGVDRVFTLLRTIKQYGGIRQSFLKIFRMDSLRPGVVVGVDKFGNKYFENNYYFYGRNRWVEYAPQYGMDYDGSQVPVEWFGWLHYKTDLLPSQDPSRPKYKWMLEHTPNLTGTPRQYMPYSTTQSTVQPWVPPPKK
ncbi:probable NADH dehydrogenase [ubiquinone] 1 alpha subcomplex subunit 12 [Dendroctonus ponderosae]|uniref:NADH dehydrogenase [ubiquinone] 1 alpha subcomplex subunit 12 n=1 Tax=Dendroctonus ponderosae TaxID=77166 RepID=U4U8H2_DENPD|nr:probable NADH dehydrogenase [ubiquinone] 1 alpha subcomplex subunit 12 [Dendroctonus ponderosae]ERL90224.1 hypothetical protein D910_07577 [Dendroctonus ponderosae]KAH1018687.1 hypothetical protein HUJ05_006411 [Dendroctonus ponderosae]